MKVSLMRNKAEMALNPWENHMTDDLENVLCEIFGIEEENDLSCISEQSIYDLSDEHDIELRLKREQLELDEGSASVEDIEQLLIQAKAYFSQPAHYYVPVENGSDTVQDYVTGYIQINAGVRFDDKGMMHEIWKSFGQKLVLDLNTLLSPEGVIARVEALGLEWNSLVRVVFYGPCLEQMIGSRIYGKSEKKELLPLSEQYSNILLAKPDYQECQQESESIFDFVEKQIKDAIQLGCSLELDRVTLGHWEMTHARLAELKEMECEEKYLARFERGQKQAVAKRNDFDANFKSARLIIAGLNNQTMKVSDLFSEDEATLAKVLFLCEKQQERISNPALYFQVKALAKKKKQEAAAPLLENQSALGVIQKINKGEHVDIHLLNLDDLAAVFAILWGHTGMRISAQYKDRYFDLKERYQHLQTASKKQIA